MSLPAINLPTPAVTAAVPAQAEKVYAQAFITKLSINPAGPSGKWPMDLSVVPYDQPSQQTQPGATPQKRSAADVMEEVNIYPGLAPVMGGLIVGLSGWIAADDARTKLAADLVALNAANTALAAAQQLLNGYQATLAKATAEPDTNPNKAPALARLPGQITAQTAVVATATAAQAAAQTLVWVTDLAAWRAAGAPLGTTAHQLPPQLVGLPVPAGVTI